MTTLTNKQKREIEKRNIEARIKAEQKANKEFKKKLQKQIEALLIDIKALGLDLVKDNHIQYKELLNKADSNTLLIYRNRLDDIAFDKELLDEADKQGFNYKVNKNNSKSDVLKAIITIHVISIVALEKKQVDKETLDRLKQEEEIIKLLTLKYNTDPSSKLAKEIIESYHKVTATTKWKETGFSDRLWANNKEFRDKVYHSVTKMILRNQKPDRFAKDLIKFSKLAEKNAYNAARGLLLNEVGNTLTLTQGIIFANNGFEKYQYICEPTACELCIPLDEQIFNLKDMIGGVNAPQIHPYCKCSIIPYED